MSNYQNMYANTDFLVRKIAGKKVKSGLLFKHATKKLVLLAALSSLSVLGGTQVNAEDTGRVLTDRIIVNDDNQVVTGVYENRKWNGGSEWWNEWNVVGGVVRNNSQGLKIENATFDNNAVYTYGADWMSALGGAVGNAEGAVISEIKDSVFKNNLAMPFEPGVTPDGTNLSAHGGAIYNGGTIGVIDNVTFSNNSVAQGSYTKNGNTVKAGTVSGSAIYNSEVGTIGKIVNSTFENHSGDVIFNYGSSIGNIENTTFKNSNVTHLISNQVNWGNVDARGQIGDIKDSTFENISGTIFSNFGGDIGYIQNSTFTNHTGGTLFENQTNPSTGARATLKGIINSTFDGGNQYFFNYQGDIGDIVGSTFKNSTSRIFQGHNATFGDVTDSTFSNIKGSVFDLYMNGSKLTTRSRMGDVSNSTFDTITGTVFHLESSDMGDISDSTFTHISDNVFFLHGGGVGDITNSVFDSNSKSVIFVSDADSLSKTMGGIYNSKFTNNAQASYSSAVIYSSSMGIKEIIDSEFSNNGSNAIWMMGNSYTDLENGG